MRCELKSRGAFFTPREVCDFVTQWAIRDASDLVLDPSCGDAEFLLSAADRIESFRSGTAGRDSAVYGVELHPVTAQKAHGRLIEAGVSANIANCDFFEASLPCAFDAVVGNPPYVRYQEFSGQMRQRSREAALALGVRLTGLSSSWAAFVIHATKFLKSDGRLGLVLPAELMTVNYAAPVRSFLLRRFARVRLIVFEELVFPGVLEEVVLLLAEGVGPTDHFELYQIRNISELNQVERSPGRPSIGPGKVLSALLQGSVQRDYSSLIQNGQFVPMQQWGESYLGMVTGNNGYFTLSARDAVRLGIPESELLKVSPPGSRHLRGLSFSRQAWQELETAGARVYLFFPDTKRPSIASTRYIRDGELHKVHTAYKCRVRKPWWKVPLVQAPDLLFTYMNHDTPRVVTNDAEVHYLNSLHGIRLGKQVRDLGRSVLPLASLNSVTMLGAEIVGRAYGGGMLKLEPKEADALPLPSPSTVMECMDELAALKPQLSTALRGGDLERAVSLVDRVILNKFIGLSGDAIMGLRHGREALFARRMSRANS